MNRVISLILANPLTINSNIIETNILNLTIVLAIVILYLGGKLKELFANRKENILSNLQEAEHDVFEGQKRVKHAKFQLEKAKKKALIIRERSLLIIEQEKDKISSEFTKEFKRLENIQQETLKLEKKKVKQQLTKKLIKLSLMKALQKIKLQLKASNQDKLNNFKIVLFANYKEN